jgi:hypothetical protein
MVRRHAHDRPVLKGGARGGGLLLTLLGVLITQASQAQEAAPAASGGADAGAIDTSITVQSSRATKPLHTIDSARMKSGIGAQMPRQQAFPSPRDRPMPNAVGFPVARSGLPQAALPAAPQPPTASANPNAPAGLAGAGDRSGRPANHAGINGTGMTLPGSGPGIVRGAPKSPGMISGSNLPPKR